MARPRQANTRTREDVRQDAERRAERVARKLARGEGIKRRLERNEEGQIEVITEKLRPEHVGAGLADRVRAEVKRLERERGRD
jgi:hypothetical protein